MPQKESFDIPAAEIGHFIEQALQWAMQEEEYLAYYTNCKITYPYGAFQHVLAIGAHELLELGDIPFQKLQQKHEQQPGWRFGYLTYDLKNKIHGLSSRHKTIVPFALCTFFSPKHLLLFNDCGVEIESIESPMQIFNAIRAVQPVPLRACKAAQPKALMDKQEYLARVAAIKNHIREGDCYELNLCFAFGVNAYEEDPLMLFRQLKANSPAPFTCFHRYGHQFLISASPERFLKKEADLLISQPIKGTIKRGETLVEDELLKAQLAKSEKDRAENLMIVDLVRNDLARSCTWGTVAVPELFGIYSFQQVHQMTSTITGRLRPGVPFMEAVKAAFPMGSMTGAPKKIVMELIDQYELTQRGLYSGAAGYITPAGDFDFNVVIRSMLYDTQHQKLTFSVGGAITWDSDPEQEYAECLLKAKAILQLLQAGTNDL